MVEKLKHIWMNGKLVDWDKATVHVLTHTLHYGMGAFEGIRSYASHDGGQAVFRLKDHVRRLFDSCHIANLKIPFSKQQITEGCKEVLSTNGLREGYVRPLVYLGAGAMGVYPADNPVEVSIIAWKWGKYLGPEALEKGIRCKFSTFSRYSPNTMMTRGKLVGNYTTSVLAKSEAKKEGYDEAILLDVDGYVAEGSGENIFIVRDNVIKTTPFTCILPGITRDTIMRVARDLGYEVVETKFTRDELYIADEVFFTGTAAEVTPIREVDGRQIGEGKPGPVTRKIQGVFFDIVSGRARRYASWLDPFVLRKGLDGAPAPKSKAKAAKV